VKKVGVAMVISNVLVYILIFTFWNWLFDIDKYRVSLGDYIYLLSDGIKTQGIVTNNEFVPAQKFKERDIYVA
jgi:hypothetical protein